MTVGEREEIKQEIEELKEICRHYAEEYIRFLVKNRGEIVHPLSDDPTAPPPEVSVPDAKFEPGAIEIRQGMMRAYMAIERREWLLARLDETMMGFTWRDAPSLVEAP